MIWFTKQLYWGRTFFGMPMSPLPTFQCTMEHQSSWAKGKMGNSETHQSGRIIFDKCRQKGSQGHHWTTPLQTYWASLIYCSNTVFADWHGEQIIFYIFGLCGCLHRKHSPWRARCLPHHVCWWSGSYFFERATWRILIQEVCWSCWAQEGSDFGQARPEEDCSWSCSI